MGYGLTQTVAPTAEPLTLADAKPQCRVAVSVSDEDALLNRLITAARIRAEKETARQLMPATYALTLDRFPFWSGGQGMGGTPNINYSTALYAGFFEYNMIRLMGTSPLQSVSSITYIATDGTLTTWAADQYQVDTTREPARIRPAYGLFYPVVRIQMAAVTVTYVAGYADAAHVPAGILQAMLLMIGAWYMNREDSIEIPQAASCLLAQYHTGEVA